MAPATTGEETRNKILAAAFDVFHQNGFQGSSLNLIIEKAGITKGALFHHFRGKNDLGYAVVEEVISPECHLFWIKPLLATNDPISALIKVMQDASEEAHLEPEVILNGCPLNNLAQEMSPLDEGFRQRLEAIYDAWRQAYVDAFRRGIAHGNVKESVDPEVVGPLIVAMLEGMIGTIKSCQQLEMADLLGRGFVDYLNLLKP